MDNINDLEIQNLQDSLSTMYIILARSISHDFGNSGQAVLRETVRRFGSDLGLTNQKYHIENNIKINLKNLSKYPFECYKDPRFRENHIRLDEQVHFRDVFTCPISNVWRSADDKKLGRFFCEEFYHAYYGAYCFNKSQINLSKMLTNDGDHHCQFSVNFRPSNLPKNLVEKCFGKEDQSSIESFEKSFLPKDAKEMFKTLWLKLFYYLLEVSTEKFGAEGQLAIANGLRTLALKASDFIKERADMTGNKVNIEFANKNYPVDIDMENDTFWIQYSKNDAKRILNINFIRLFNKNLGF